MEENQEFIVAIENTNKNRTGVRKVDDYIWFVKDAVIGDVVRAKAMEIKKLYGLAGLVEVLEPSVSRVIPSYPVVRQCDGCQLQAMSYEEQLKFEERKVMNNLIRTGKFAEDEIHMLPIMGIEESWRYRNRAQLPFGKDKDESVITGFHAGWTHAIVETEDCLLGIRENREILDTVRQFTREMKVESYDEISHRELVRHVLVWREFKTGEIIVCLVINGKKLPEKECLVGMLIDGDGKDGKGQGVGEQGTKGLEVKRQDTSENEAKGYISDKHVNRYGIKGMASISYSANQERTNVIMRKEIVSLYDPGFITDYIGNVKYQISSLSLYQVNPVQTKRLHGTALEYAELTGNETVQGLHCEIDAILLFLTQKAKKVCSVEIVPQAIGGARRNAEIDGIDNAEFSVGKAEEALPKQFEKNHAHADMIMADPPRRGCDTVCLDTMFEMKPERVIYVSCDSATLVRDLRYLADGRYVMERRRCCDMFPGTVHVKVVIKMAHCGDKRK